MPRTRLRALIAGLTHLPTAATPDLELLRRFTAHRDEAAFEALVWRHGPMVRAVCRQVLGGRPDADDAFQATFLVLARKAGHLRSERGLGGWLYRVAGRVAKKLSARLAKAPTAADLGHVAAPYAPPEDAALRDLLDDEIGRLPEKYRLPVQLCYVAGHTTADAAHRLGCPKGTLLTRLAWARRQLQERLIARGVAPGLGALAAVAVTLDAARVRGAVAAAVADAAGTPALVSPVALTLTEGVLHAMWFAKIKVAVGVLLVLGAVGVGTVATVEGQAPPGGVAPAPVPATAPAKAPPAKAPPAPKKPPAAQPAGPGVGLPEPLPASGAGIGTLPPGLSGPGAGMALPAPVVPDDLANLRRELDQMRAELAALKKTPPRDPLVPGGGEASEGGPPGLMPAPTGAAALPDPTPTAVPATTTPTAGPVFPPSASVPANPPATALPMPIMPTVAPPAPRTGPTPPARTVMQTTTIRPAGSYHRAAAGHSMQLKFDGDRLTITNVVNLPDGPQTVTVEADYGITRDGVVFGYITGIDAPEEAVGIQKYSDVPFSFRFRANDDSVTVKDVKIGRVGAEEPPTLIVAGKYTDKPQPAKPLPAKPPVRRSDIDRNNLPSLYEAPRSPVPSANVPSANVPRIEEVPTPRTPPAAAPATPAKQPKRDAATDEPTATDAPAGRGIRYHLRQEFDAETNAYRSYYEPYTYYPNRSADPFERPDGSHSLLSPGVPPPPSQVIPPADVPRASEVPSQSRNN